MTELLYQLALTQLPQIGDVHARTLVQQLGSAAAVFKAKQKHLEKIEGIGMLRAQSIVQFRDFAKAENEMAFLDRYGIQPLFFTDAAYPKRLLHCADAPVLLFYKGTANLNAAKILAIVGTRYNTDYGKRFTEQLLSDLSDYGVTVVSGMAFGIDAIAHKAALHNGLPTIGVVGHGLDRIYPYAHKELARDMLQEGGGLLTEFWSGTAPDRFNFPLRNRIVAGMSDATLVIETDLRGGSMITAQLADGYNRDVFALPGRTSDSRSRGCNHLIQHNRAILLSDARALLQCLGWDHKTAAPKKVQPELFVALSSEERSLVEMLKEKETMHIDEINLRCGMSSSAIAAAILNLELNNMVQSLPGKRYQLVGTG